MGNGSNAACVCLDSSWGKFTSPSHFFSLSTPALLLLLPLEESQPNRYSRGRRRRRRRGGFGEQTAEREREREGDAEGRITAPCLVPGSALESPGGAKQNRIQWLSHLFKSVSVVMVTVYLLISCFYKHNKNSRPFAGCLKGNLPEGLMEFPHLCSFKIKAYNVAQLRITYICQ